MRQASLRRRIGTGLALLVSAAGVPHEAPAQDDDAVRVESIGEGLHRITVHGGWEATVVAFGGPDGLLLVDSGFRSTGPALVDALAGLGYRDVTYLVNTHSHKDHTGGNNLLGRGATVIGHAKLADKLTVGSLVLEDYTADALPDLAVDGTLTLSFNGEDVVLVALDGAAHDETDLIVWFRGAGVAYLGDLAYGMHFPSTDYFRGSLLAYPEVITRLVELLPPDTYIVSGHGRDHSYAELVQFRDMLVETRAIVRAAHDRGLGAEEIVAQGLLDAWASYEYPGMVTTRSYVTTMLRDLDARPLPDRNILGALYDASKRGDGDAVYAEFERIRREEPEPYGLDYPWFRNIVVNHLFTLGGRLAADERPADAIRVFDIILDRYPETAGIALVHRRVGQARLELLDFTGARQSFRSVLETVPDDAFALERLALLEGVG